MDDHKKKTKKNEENLIQIVISVGHQEKVVEIMFIYAAKERHLLQTIYSPEKNPSC